MKILIAIICICAGFKIRKWILASYWIKKKQEMDEANKDIPEDELKAAENGVMRD